jgi:hypothetical protein
MDIEGELGIGPTTDKREIRRAYARRLKETHPEDDPEGFKRLRSAYEAALNYADYMAEDEEEADLPEIPADPEGIEPVRTAIREPDSAHDGTAPPEEEEQDDGDRRLLGEMAGRVGKLLNDGDDRGAAAALEAAISDQFMLNLTNRRIFELMLLEEIGDRDPPPPETAKAAVRAFRWDEHWTDLPYDYQYLADRLMAVPLAEERLAELRRAANTRFTNDHEKTAARLLFGPYRPIVFKLNNSLHVLEAMRQLIAELHAEHPEVLEKEVDPRVLAWWTKATGDSGTREGQSSTRIAWIVFGIFFAISLLRRLLSD